jgi:hypothetical protein
MALVDEMVAREKIPIVFDDGNIPAGLPENTQRMLLIKGSSGGLLKYLHLDQFDVFSLPFVEDGAEEIAPGFSRDGIGKDFAHFVYIRFHQGDKGHILGLDLFKKPVNRERMLYILGIDHTKQIDRDLMFPEQVVPVYDLIISGAASFKDAVLIMYFLRTVQAETDGKPFGGKKAAPLFIEEGAVGLDPIGNAPIWGLVPALKGHDFVKKIDAQKGRLTTMPGKVDCRRGRGCDVLDDVPFQDIVGHAKRLTFWVEELFF